MILFTIYLSRCWLSQNFREMVLSEKRYHHSWRALYQLGNFFKNSCSCLVSGWRIYSKKNQSWMKINGKRSLKQLPGEIWRCKAGPKVCNVSHWSWYFRFLYVKKDARNWYLTGFWKDLFWKINSYVHPLTNV